MLKTETIYIFFSFSLSLSLCLFSFSEFLTSSLCFVCCVAITLGAAAIAAIASLFSFKMNIFFSLHFGIRIILIISTILLKSTICRHHLWCVCVFKCIFFSLSSSLTLSLLRCNDRYRFNGIPAKVSLIYFMFNSFVYVFSFNSMVQASENVCVCVCTRLKGKKTPKDLFR